jgi:copper chaperone CopZ
MKTSVIEVHDMLSVLSVLGVENRIGEVPGVESVTVNYAAGSATVRYDETRLDIGDIRSAVRQSGYEVAEAPAAASKGDSHEGHTAPSEPPATPALAAAKTPPVTPAAAGTTSPGTSQEDKTGPGAAPSTAPKPSSTASAAAPAPASATAKSVPDAAPAGDEQHDKMPPGKS